MFNQATWQHELSDVITQIEQLAHALELPPSALAAGEQARAEFALRVPKSFVARMQKKDPNDPLLLQVLPQAVEMLDKVGFVSDPVGDLQANPTPGLLHKYHGRVLLTLAGSCAINCRYCFRRHFPYAENTPDQHWKRALDYIKKDSSIEEVILSGGDPLLVKDVQLAKLSDKLEEIPHLKRLRIHTRLPIVIPSRITSELTALLKKSRLNPVIVVHSNHANEINQAVIDAMKMCRDANITLLNQAVLLKNVNDNVDALAALSEALFNAGIMPYYLHLLDKVKGAAHFDTQPIKAQDLMQALSAKLPGYLVPKLVREVAGMPAKQQSF